MLTKLTQNEYKVSFWSGGTTTQLVIYPSGAEYADRDFLWRVSSASVDADTSVFTPLPDYDRLIAPLSGSIALTLEGEEPVKLDPLEVFAFDGGAAVKSEGRCTDFNLMLRKGSATGEMFSASTEKKEKVFGVDLASRETAVFYVAKGRAEAICGAENEPLRAGETCIARANWECSVRIRLAPRTAVMIAVITPGR